MSPSTPNTTNIRAWVDALRSGRYEQGRRALRQEFWDGSVQHCCLGVACEVAIAHGVDIERSGARYGDRADMLPAAASAWLGMPSGNPVLDGIAAVERNDDLRQSFAQIATAIETEYLS